LALILIAALGNTFMQNLTTQMANDTATLQDGVVVLISAMLLVALSLKIPLLLGGIITGVHHAGNIATVERLRGAIYLVAQSSVRVFRHRFKW
jgi:type IV secretory pathway TrbL component